FSGGRQGLGLSQAGTWRAHLEALAEALGVADRVTFTGGVPDAELDVAITRSRAVLLPSVLEGFGLAAVEGWLYGRPALVSRGAGVAELVVDGVNGATFAPGDDAALADAMLALARDEDLALRMGEEGRRTARACHLARGARDVWDVLRGAMVAAPGERAPARGRP
ncbi:MAG TPA: glycosyltransferase, partial [Candidatus Thermoplasmatota archaeon]|nr:glycosyltransferase [Candidatus Thermoplasmatota archaeon]